MGRGSNPEKSAAGMISSVPLVGWGVISLKKCRYWGAALPPDDRMPLTSLRPPRGMEYAPASQTPMFGCGTAAGYRIGFDSPRSYLFQ